MQQRTVWIRCLGQPDSLNKWLAKAAVERGSARTWIKYKKKKVVLVSVSIATLFYFAGSILQLAAQFIVKPDLPLWDRVLATIEEVNPVVLLLLTLLGSLPPGFLLGIICSYYESQTRKMKVSAIYTVLIFTITDIAYYAIARSGLGPSNVDLDILGSALLIDIVFGPIVGVILAFLTHLYDSHLRRQRTGR